MLDNIIIPDAIKNKIAALNNIIEKYPDKIPAEKAAKFLKVDIEVFRRMVEQGQAPFAFGCSNGVYGNRYAYVASLPFYLWFMAPVLKN